MTNNSKRNTKIVNQQFSQKEYIFNNIPKWIPYAILLFTFLIYFKSLFNGFVNLDDDAYILQNLYIRDFSFNGIKDIFSSFYNVNYHPITTLLYLLLFKFFGVNPFAYHFISIILHLCNSFLVYVIIKQISKKEIAAIFVMLLFAIHPLHVESVVWASELKDVLYAFFYLLAIKTYLNYLNAENKTKLYFILMLYFICSLLSKSAAVTLPVLLFAIDYYLKRNISKSSIIEKIPLFVLSIIIGIVTIVSQQQGGAVNDFSLTYNFIDRIFLLSYAISFYVIKLFLPFNLSVIHPFPVKTNGMLPAEYYLSLIFIVFIIYLIFKRSVIKKEKIFGSLFFVITIALMLHIIPVGISITAERYTYISYIGIFFVIGIWLSNSFSRVNIKLLRVLLVTILCVFSIQTFLRIDVWKDGNTLFTDAIKKNPNSGYGYFYRANLKNDNANYKSALEDYNLSLLYNPNFLYSLLGRAEALVNLNQYKSAINDINIIMNMNCIDVVKSKAHNIMGMAYFGLKDYNAAQKEYDAAILLNKNNSLAYRNRGMLKAMIGKIEDALTDVNTSIELGLDNSTSFNYRANIKFMLKDYKSAIADYDIATNIDTNYASAFYNKAICRLNLQDTLGACDDLKKSFQLGYKDAEIALNKFCK